MLATRLRRHFKMDDIRNVLLHGTVSSQPEWNERFQNWNYSVTGLDCENDPLVLIIALQPSPARITIITGKDVSQ